MAMKKISVFQLVILGIFAFFIVVAVLVFAGLSGGGGGNSLETVEVWGTFDPDLFDKYLNELGDISENANLIKYRYIEPEEYESEIVNALASGNGPDLFLIDQSQILQYWDKITPIPYDEAYGMKTYSRREFMDIFVDEGSLFLSERGILGLPFSVDPMVLYWNRDLFADAGKTVPPKYWDELIDLSSRITKKQQNGVIDIAAVGLGTYDNINHAKDILVTMLTQKGGKVIEKTPEGQLFSALASSVAGEGFSQIPAMQIVLRFYTEFANPSKFFYTYNRSLPNSLDLFSQGRLAMYIGYASELNDIKNKNPNLNFDVAPLPQIREDAKRNATFGRLYAFVVPKHARDPYSSIAIALFLTQPTQSALFSKYHTAMPPLRIVLNKEADNPVQEIFRRSAVIAFGWLDPDPKNTDAIFANMVNSVLSGKLRFSEAVSYADKELKALLEKWK